MPVDSNRFQAIFLLVAKLPDPTARSAFLDVECGADRELRGTIEAFLRVFDRPESLTLLVDPSVTAAFLPQSAETLTFTSNLQGQETIDPPPIEDSEQTSAHVSNATPEPNEVTPSRKPTKSDARQKSSAHLLTGEVIADRYTLGPVIGEGGMGSVYLATQTEPIKRQVALKLIKAGMDSRSVLARFDAERQALALMDHPNIARVYDGGSTATGQPYFVMELVNGVPLTNYCDSKHLSPRARLELFVAICRAVQHAHQKGIIHRDLKPSNVLITEVDGRPTPKIIDFGVAKATEHQLTDMSYYDEGVVVGTPAYMSPEQADPLSMDIDTRTDVYALGVILYELLTGTPPISPSEFRRGAMLEMLRMVREVEPPRPSTRISSANDLPSIAANRSLEPRQLINMLRGDIDWIVMKSLEKDRERRYDSANGLAADVLRYIADEPVMARPPSRSYRLRKFVRRNRTAVQAACAFAVLFLIGVVGVIYQWREAVHERNEANIARTNAETSSRVALEQRKVALDAVGQLVTTVRTELVKKPDLQGVLRKVLQIGQDSLDNISQNPLVDISLNDTTRAAAHDATARMYRDLGNTPTALQEFKKAADIYRAILDKSAEGADKEVVKKNLLIVLISLGQTTLRTGSQEEAAAYYQQATQVIATLDNKTATDFRKILISLYTSLAATTMDQRPRQARENYLAALKIAEETSAREVTELGTASEETRLTLGRLASGLAGIEMRLRDVASSEQYFSKALSIANEMLKARPDDRVLQHAQASARERLGDLYLRTNRPAEALKEYAGAAAVCKAIAVADPKNVDAQADHSRILYSQGLAALRTGQKDPSYFQASLEIRKLRPNLQTETVGQRDLMMSLAQTGKHREAVEMAESVRTKLAKDPGALVDIACCYAVSSATVPAMGADQATHEQYVLKAIEALKQAIDVGYGDKVNLETEPDLDAVRNLPGFKELLNRLAEP